MLLVGFIHVTSGTLVFAFARAYSSGIATVIVPQNMRPAIISPHAYLAWNNLDFTAATESTATWHVQGLRITRNTTTVTL